MIARCHGLDLGRGGVGARYGMQILAQQETFKNIGNDKIAMVELINSRACHAGFVGYHFWSSSGIICRLYSIAAGLRTNGYLPKS
jgi:hypothetical protein